MDSKNYVWKSASAKRFSFVVSKLQKDDLQKFLSDVMTKKEIEEISARLEAALLLKNGVTYTDIAKKTRLSSRTIARISDWIKNGAGGYKNAFDLLDTEDHIEPV